MRNCILLLFITLIFCGCTHFFDSSAIRGEDGAWTTTNIIQKGQRLDYVFGGHFWCRTRPDGNEDPLNGERKVRDFIWENFTGKKIGYIKLSCAGIDTSNTTHYFIEPDETDTWNIVRKRVYQNSDMTFRFENDALFSIERGKSENPDSDDWVLISKAKNGQIIERIPIF